VATPLSYTPLAVNRFDARGQPAESSAHSSATRPVNLTELCANSNHPVSSSERQLLAYVSSIEAVAGTIQELDDAVLQLKSPSRSCELGTNLETNPSPRDAAQSNATDAARSANHPMVSESRPTNKPNLYSPSYSTPVAATMPFNDESVSPADSSGPSEVPLSPTESFLDSPSGSASGSMPPINADQAATGGRAKRENFNQTGPLSPSTPSEPNHFGLPTHSSSNLDDQAEDLARASSDLKALRRDLSSTAEWLRQTNHTVHSALLRALVSYVSSIEKRIDSQRQVFVAQARMAALRSKVAVVKEKMAALLEKLKSLIPHKAGGGVDPNGDGATVTMNRADNFPAEATQRVSVPTTPTPRATTSTEPASTSTPRAAV